MSQYDFRKSIALSWLDSETDQKQKRDDVSVVTTNNSMGSSNKARRINEVSLDPLSGALWIWLDDHVHYLVLPAAKWPCCSLCWWVEPNWDANREWCLNIGTCDKCNVSLCISCFKPIHRISDLKKLKNEVMKSKMRWEGGKMCGASCFMYDCAGGCHFQLERKKVKQICRQITNNETLPIFNMKFDGNKHLSKNNCCVDEIGCFFYQNSRKFW